MRKIVTLVKPYKLARVIGGLQSNGFERVYFEEVKFFDFSNGNIKSFFPRIVVSVFLSDKDIDKFKDIIISATNDIKSNNNIFEISKVVKSVDIDTGKIEYFDS